MIGPSDNPTFSTFCVSPLGIATLKYLRKKKISLIIDLLAPHEDSVLSINSLIPLAPFSLLYATMGNAIQFIKLAGKGAWLGNVDIIYAIKVMLLHPLQWHLFGVKWMIGCISQLDLHLAVAAALASLIPFQKCLYL